MKNLGTKLILVVLLILFILLSFLVWGFEFAFDKTINSFWQSIDENQVITNFFLLMAWLWDVIWVIMITFFVLLYLFYKKSFHQMLFFIMTMLVTVWSSTLVKILVKRDRPENMIIDYHGFSFPSWHSTMAVLFYGLLLFIFLPKIKSQFIKKILIILSIIIGVLIIFSRIYLSVHWFSDVIWGILLWTFFLIFSIYLYKSYLYK